MHHDSVGRWLIKNAAIVTPKKFLTASDSSSYCKKNHVDGTRKRVFAVKKIVSPRDITSASLR